MLRHRPDAIFGAATALERERRRITLASIAANTKIGLHLLEGLERGQRPRWPSGIFRRSFIRAYAEAIGLDPDEITRRVPRTVSRTRPICRSSLRRRSARRIPVK